MGKVEDKYKILIGVVLIVVILVLVLIPTDFLDDEVDEPAAVVAPGKVGPVVVDYSKYNYDFVDENVKGILNRMIGSSGKTAFYLPPTGWINVSKGSNFGVAFALNNPNPSGENFFVFNWSVDDSIVESCGVSKEVGQSWIERGWTSWGKIPKGWIDHMTVYLAFPEDAPSCSVKYNFLIEKDGAVYDRKQIEFRIS